MLSKSTLIKSRNSFKRSNKPKFSWTKTETIIIFLTFWEKCYQKFKNHDLHFNRAQNVRFWLFWNTSRDLFLFLKISLPVRFDNLAKFSFFHRKLDQWFQSYRSMTNDWLLGVWKKENCREFLKLPEFLQRCITMHFSVVIFSDVI